MSIYCEIVVKDQLDTNWSGWFDGLAVTHNDRANAIISGQLRDQSAFYGLLTKVRDMGLFLVLVKYEAERHDEQIHEGLGLDEGNSSQSAL